MRSSIFMLIILALLPISVTAGIKDHSLLGFCTSPLLDSRHGYEHGKREMDDFCEQVLDFKVPSGMEKQACKDMAPYTVKDARADGTGGYLKCQWMTKSICPEPYHIHIHDRCYYVGRQSEYSAAAGVCQSKKMTLHTVASREQAKWISIFMGDSPLWVANKLDGRSALRAENMESMMWTLSGGGSFVAGTSEQIAITVDTDYEYDVAAGRLIRVKDGDRLRVLCSRPASVINNDDQPEYFIPAIMVQPRITSDGRVDTTIFHEICAKRMAGYRAALADERTRLNGIMLKEDLDVVYVAGESKKSLEAKDECDPKYKGQDYAREFVAVKPKGNNGYEKVSSTGGWQTDMPDNRCADYGRMAVAFHAEKGAVDIPPISRHCIVCLKGDVKLIEAKRCPDTAFFNEQTQQCQCKEGYVDFKNTTFASQHRDSFPWGTKCTMQNCKQQDKSSFMLFVVDGSGSINSDGNDNYHGSVIPFLKSAKKTLSNQMKVGFIEFSSHVSTPVILEPNWTPQQFDNMFKEPYMGGQTCTHDALAKAKQLLDDDKSDQRRVVLVTDGEPYCNNRLEYAEAEQASNVIKNTLKTTLTAVGIGPSLNEQVLINIVGRQNYLSIKGSFTNLNDDWMKSLTAMVCADMNESDFIQ